MSPLPDFPRRESQRDPDTETGRDVGIFRGTESLLTLRWREMDSNLYGAFRVK